MKIVTRDIGGAAVVELELGPPHNTTIEVGTFWKYGLLRLAQEIEHDLDYMGDVANKLRNKPNAAREPRGGAA